MISLVVATINRVAELDRLLTSLDSQTYQDFEVIVIDQNRDDRLVSVPGRHQRLMIRHLRSERGLSHARNVGLRVIRGDIVAFPDDDCWYPEWLLASVVDGFGSHPGLGALFATMHSADGKPVGPRWPAGACSCTKENLWDCALSTTGFLRRSTVDAVGLFDENIGVGATSQFQSGEETDYYLRALALGYAMRYEPSLIVHHPELNSIKRLRSVSYSFALGSGYVLRIHGYSWRSLGRRLLVSFGGAVVSACKGDLARAHTYFLRGAGQLQGYVFGPRMLKRLTESSSQ